jgi:hypothetical protein
VRRELLPSEKPYQGRSDSSRIIVGQFIHVPDGIFSVKNDDFEGNKNCVVRKKKYSESETSSEESGNTSNVGATMWLKEDKTPNLGPFTRNPRVKQILSDPTKV